MHKGFLEKSKKKKKPCKKYDNVREMFREKKEETDSSNYGVHV